MAAGDAAEVLQLGEELFDQFALALEPLAEAALPLAIALRVYARRCTLVLDQLADRVGVILSASPMVRGLRWSSRRFTIYPSCVCPAMRVSVIEVPARRRNVDLGRKPASGCDRDNDLNPFLTFAACWYPRMEVLSII